MRSDGRLRAEDRSRSRTHCALTWRALAGRSGLRVESLDAVKDYDLILCDVSPRQLIAIGGRQLSNSYQARLKKFRYGPGVFKVDYALSAPIPWRAPECARAATVHLGGTFEEIALAEKAV